MRHMARLLVMIGCVVAATYCYSDSQSEQALQLVAQGALLVDVRSAEEFSGQHLPGAINIPHQQIVQTINNKGFDADRSIVLYCRSGNRSGIAKGLLEQAGYRSVFNGGSLQELQRQNSR